MTTDSRDQSILNKSRADKFILVVDIPSILKPINRKSVRDNRTIQLNTLQFSVYGVVVPKIQVPAIALNYSGSPIHITSRTHPTYAPVNVNFTIDNQFNNYWVIYTWLNTLRNAKTGLYGEPSNANEFLTSETRLKDYAADFTVIAKDEYENDVIKWVYKHAFPTNLGEITYNHRTSTEIETTFEFVFAEVECTLL